MLQLWLKVIRLEARKIAAYWLLATRVWFHGSTRQDNVETARVPCDLYGGRDRCIV